MPIASSGNQEDKRVWPSLQTANTVFNLATVIFIVSLVFGVVTTILITWMANVKESHWDIERDRAREHIASLDLQLSDAARKLIEVQREVGARYLTPSQYKIITTAMSKVRIQVHLTIQNEQETVWYAGQLNGAFLPADNRVVDKYVEIGNSTARGLRLSGGRKNADPIANAFKEAGVKFDYSPSYDLDSAEPAELLVALKPIYQPQFRPDPPN